MNKFSIKNNNLKIINTLICLNIEKVKILSPNIYDSVLLNWNNYLDKTNGKNKLDRSIEKIKKAIEKLEKIEKKKLDQLDFNKILDENLEIIKKEENTQFKINLMENIERQSNFYLLLNELINLYLKEEQKIKTERVNLKNEMDMNLPKIKKENENFEETSLIELPIFKKEVNRYSLVNNHIYANIDYVNGVMIFNEEAFIMENNDYSDNLKNKLLNFSNLNFNNYNLSPFEKRRRIYIQTMYDLDLELRLLIDKKVDIAFPLEKMYKCSKMFIDNIYKELIDNTNPSNVLDFLLNKTIEVYGCINKIDKYDYVYSKIMFDINQNSKYVIEELKNEAMRLKKSGTFIYFKNVEEIFPSKKDILKVLNEKIIANLNSNFNIFFKDMSLVKSVTRFMTVDEVCDFYIAFKECMSFSNTNISNKKYFELQSIICEIIKSSISMDNDRIIKEILKEDIIF